MRNCRCLDMVQVQGYSSRRFFTTLHEETNMASLGYTDTPFIPDSLFRVHDDARPQPRIVTPGTTSTQDQPGQPPRDAVILFDGRHLDDWTDAKGAPAKWLLQDGAMEVAPKSGNIRTRRAFGSCQLHLELCEPSTIRGDSQGRGNSGVFLMTRYEIQVLDNYDNPTYADGTMGAIYGQYPPLVNACRKPGEWQTYDIIWEAPIFSSGSLVTPAYVTVLLNGILLHHRQPLQGPTQHREATAYEPHDEEAPLELQDHGDPVRFRNIWYRPLTAYDQA